MTELIDHASMHIPEFHPEAPLSISENLHLYLPLGVDTHLHAVQASFAQDTHGRAELLKLGLHGGIEHVIPAPEQGSCARCQLRVGHIVQKTTLSE